MFQVYFIYNTKGPYYIYYKKTEEQKELNQVEIDRINKEEVEAKYYIVFNAQEREKERKQDIKRQKQPKKRISQEVYQKRNIFKKGVLQGEVNNLRYIYKVLKPLLILYQ